MDFGVTGKLGGYHLAEQYQKKAAGKSGGVSFAELAQKVMGRVVSSSEFAEARRAREAKHAEYERPAEEAALKRRLMEQEADERYYKDSMTKKAVSIAAYEAAGILR